MYDALMAMSVALAAIGAGLMAGVYFAFSGFIMRSLDQLGAAQATDAMNSINKIILRSWFMPLFFCSTVLFAILSMVGLINTDLAGRWILVVSGLVYVVGMFVCTALFNVPLNNRLAHGHSEDNNQSEIWALYFLQWTRWNHVRALCSLASMVLCMYYLARFV